MSEFGAALRRHRQAAGLSLADIAGRTHFSKGYLSKIENGRSPASRYIAEVCDDALDAGGDLLALVPDESEGQPATGLPHLGPLFLGRSAELQHLTEALQNPRGPAAFVIAGLAGIGKTALATMTVTLVEHAYTWVVWRSLRNAPPLEELLGQCIQVVSNHQAQELPAGVAQRIGDSLLSDPEDGCVDCRRETGQVA